MIQSNVPSGYITFFFLKVELKDFISPGNHWFMKYPHPLMTYLHFFKEIRTYCGWKPSHYNILNRIIILLFL